MSTIEGWRNPPEVRKYNMFTLTTFCRDVFWQDGEVIPGCDDNGVFFMNSGYLYILKDQFSENREKAKLSLTNLELSHECQVILMNDPF